MNLITAKQRNWLLAVPKLILQNSHEGSY